MFLKHIHLVAHEEHLQAQLLQDLQHACACVICSTCYASSECNSFLSLLVLLGDASCNMHRLDVSQGLVRSFYPSCSSVCVGDWRNTDLSATFRSCVPSLCDLIAGHPPSFGVCLQASSYPVVEMMLKNSELLLLVRKLCHAPVLSSVVMLHVEVGRHWPHAHPGV